MKTSLTALQKSALHDIAVASNLTDKQTELCALYLLIEMVVCPQTGRIRGQHAATVRCTFQEWQADHGQQRLRCYIQRKIADAALQERPFLRLIELAKGVSA